MIYNNKKGQEPNPIAIIVLVVIIGLAIFFLVRFATKSDTITNNVTQINDTNISVTSNATIFVNKAGSVNISDGTNLTLRDSVVNVTLNNTDKNLTFIRVIYPNRTLTPGAIMSTNITEICVSGYSDRVRNVSQKTKDAVYIEYKLSPTQPEGAFEIDHSVPLELGGSNDISNLWPQPADPRPGYKEKDVLENYYHKQVCAGKMDIREAQSIMANNWFSGYLQAKENGGIK